MPRLLRELDPLKMTSAISPPRRLLADCSPRIQRTASTTLLLPEPFGPTTAVTPGAKSSRVLSANDLNPTSSRRLSIGGRRQETGDRRQETGCCFLSPVSCLPESAAEHRPRVRAAGGGRGRRRLSRGRRHHRAQALGLRRGLRLAGAEQTARLAAQ